MSYASTRDFVRLVIILATKGKASPEAVERAVDEALEMTRKQRLQREPKESGTTLDHRNA